MAHGVKISRPDLAPPTALAESLLKEGASTESVIAALRQSGASKLVTIAVLVKLLRLDAQSAKSLVHFSPSWADVRDRDEAFIDMAVSAVENEGRAL